MEPFLGEEQAVDRLDDALDIARSVEPLTYGIRPLIELVEVAIDVDERLLFQRNHQRSLDQVERRLRAPCDLTKALTCKRRMCEHTRRHRFHPPV